MAWYDEIEGNVNRVMDALEAREKRRREARRAKRKRAAMFATPMRRMTALLVDVVMLYLVMGTLFSFLTALAPLNLNEVLRFMSEGVEGVQQGRYSIGMVWKEGWRQGFVQRLLLNQVLQLALLALGVVPALWRWQATLGMRVVGLRLCRKDRASKPGLLRCCAFFLAGIVTLMAGYLTMVFTRDRRALHDILSGTAVVRRKEIKERDAQEAMLAADEAAEAEILAQAQAKLSEGPPTNAP